MKTIFTFKKGPSESISEGFKAVQDNATVLFRNQLYFSSFILITTTFFFFLQYSTPNAQTAYGFEGSSSIAVDNNICNYFDTNACTSSAHVLSNYTNTCGEIDNDELLQSGSSSQYATSSLTDDAAKNC